MRGITKYNIIITTSIRSSISNPFGLLIPQNSQIVHIKSLINHGIPRMILKILVNIESPPFLGSSYLIIFLFVPGSRISVFFQFFWISFVISLALFLSAADGVEFPLLYCIFCNRRCFVVF